MSAPFASADAPGLSFDVEGPASQGSLSLLSDPVLLLAMGVFLVALGLLIALVRPGRRSPKAGGRRAFGLRRRGVPAQRLKLQRDRTTVK